MDWILFIIFIYYYILLYMDNFIYYILLKTCLVKIKIIIFNNQLNKEVFILFKS